MGRGKNKAWYAKGLRFECTQCGDCCSGASGLVQFTPEEASGMAKHLGLEIKEFLESHALPGESEGLWQMKEVETEHGFDCSLLERCPTTGKTLCLAHHARPTQCRTWPFWPDNLESEGAWKKAARECEGIGLGRIVPLRVIQEQRQLTPEWGQV